MKYSTRLSKGLKQMPGVEKGKSGAEFRLAGSGTKAVGDDKESSKEHALTQSRERWIVFHLFPLRKASPPVTSVSPVSILKVDDLPAPFTPRSPKHWWYKRADEHSVFQNRIQLHHSSTDKMGRSKLDPQDSWRESFVHFQRKSL